MLTSIADHLAYALAEELTDSWPDYQEKGYGWERDLMRAWLADWLADDDGVNGNMDPADAADAIELAVERAIEIVEERLSCHY